ncbi:DUF2285 domain-containing protein [Agrobacterium tumefaciens]|uniref:DUF2285 domain-containing protein n=1 Tax=Agrobacterium tumefaciens TaxID=358 RepID=UPI001573F03F|nr:DUF2285 domain-containing protein [Agrobacterium tumefaciens]UXT20423.1 DUF2285 domain-containing protein [Agrobacterium tumefaciens]WHO20785.1 DUF2285 domain-containing protein [Agrobacterium tumefaciens]WHO23570.1 DUF2285 domain-containing protein [Agrobacterium tumefaciens]
MPQDDTSVVVLAARDDIFPSTDRVPRLDAEVSLNVDGATHFRFELGNGQHLQIVHSGVAPAVALVPLGIEGLDRLEAVQRLLAALHGRAVPPDTRLTRQQRARARRMLQAFDGHRDGATQQEIAEVIFRIGPVDRDEWQASSARHAVKALLRDARAMIAGGYRSLLRHRRST